MLYELPFSKAYQWLQRLSVRFTVRGSSPIGEHDHMVSVRPRTAMERFDHDGPVNAALLLQVGVGVVPVGSALADGEFVGEHFAGPDGRKAKAGNAVHPGRDQGAVPVDGRVLAHPVMDVDAGEVPLPEAQGGPRAAAVNGSYPRRAFP